MAKNPTKRENFVKAIEVVKDTHPELAEFFAHEIELLDKKNSRTKSKSNRENEVLAEMLKEQLKTIGRPVTITELMQESVLVRDYICENGRPLTNQKITSIFSKLIDTDEIVKTTEKRKSYYRVV